MTTFKRIACLKPQPSDNSNRITIELDGRVFTVNQRILNRYDTVDELKSDLDQWTQRNLGYVINDIWFHKNRDGTWAIATGASPPDVWPEDESVI